MSPIQQMLLGAGGAVATKTYVDDVFSTFLYTGNGSARSIDNGIDLSGEGGMVWIKNRSAGDYHGLFDTLRGDRKYVQSNASNSGEVDSASLVAFNNNGFNLGTGNDDMIVNNSNQDFSSWSFRKAPGFFTVKKFTGNGSNQTLTHDLGCVPGCIMYKNLDSTAHWVVWHRDVSDSSDKGLALDQTWSEDDDVYFNDTDPTATHFTVGAKTQTNGDGDEIIAYLFAGGKGTTDKAVDFDGSDDRLTLASTSDVNFGTGDFTVEFWLQMSDGASTHTGFFQISGTTGGLTTAFSSSLALGWHLSGNAWQIYCNGAHTLSSSFSPVANQWYHAAVVRSSGTTKVYIDGKEVISVSDSHDYDYNNLVIGGYYSTSYLMKGAISNFRIVKGQALYTNNFNVPHDPLTQTSQNAVSSNVKLICCNGSTTTAATVTPGTITEVSSPSVTTNNSIFDDTAAHVFGESGSESVIKCGSYVGNGSSIGPEINLGFEPSWILLKNATTSSRDWKIVDAMRGIVTGGDDASLRPNTTDDEDDESVIDLTPTGFKITASNAHYNENGETIIYCAIRRPDGYVGKPPSLGTGVFNMPLGLTDGTKPAFNTGFPVDFLIYKKPASTGDWYTTARLIKGKSLKTNDDAAEGTNPNLQWDFQDGMGGWSGLSSGYQSWGFKRHAGFDVVTYDGDGVAGRQMPHNLSKTPEMMWVKRRNSNDDWIIYHKGLNGGTNPEDYYLVLNSSSSESDNVNRWNDTAPTSNHFILGNDGTVNSGGTTKYIAMLFASVNGISKVGSYTGTSASSQTITTGFQPRFIIIKRVDANAQWFTFDTTRGWVSNGITTADDKVLMINANDAQWDHAFGTITSTGFVLNGAGYGNNGGASTPYIYYAHA